jgi:hypothetical protein
LRDPEKGACGSTAHAPQGYTDSRSVLLQFRRIEAQLPKSGLPDSVRHLRTDELKPLREMREACIFVYGMGQRFGVALAESQDYDAVATWVEGRSQHFAPIQLKEVIPHKLNPTSSVQAAVDGLAKYVDSQDLTVAIHLNRLEHFSPLNIVVPQLNIAALWIFAAIAPDQSRWPIWGNFLEQLQVGEFDYPTPTPADAQ